MKKIGLAVCYDTKNFGSQLQVLATVKKVEELDYKSEIIRYKKKITPTFIVQTIPRLFNISFRSEGTRLNSSHTDISRMPSSA